MTPRTAISVIIDAALNGEPQKVTRRGVLVSVVLSAEEYERLRRMDQGSAPSLGAMLLQIPQDD